MSNLKKLLRQHPQLLALSRSCYYFTLGTYGKLLGLLRNRAIYERYCANQRVRKLHLGCGYVNLDGWLNTDLLPRRPWVAYCNAAGRFPFADHSFDYVLTEHMIEHVDFRGAMRMLAECKRVLKPGGRIRISTPDLDKIMSLSRPSSDLEHRYLRYTLGNIEEAIDSQPAFVINSMMRDWGHTFIYDEKTLSAALRRAGFKQIVVCQPGRSGDPQFDGIDRHGDIFPDPDFNLVESLVIEATA